MRPATFKQLFVCEAPAQGVSSRQNKEDLCLTLSALPNLWPAHKRGHDVDTAELSQHHLDETIISAFINVFLLSKEITHHK